VDEGAAAAGAGFNAHELPDHLLQGGVGGEGADVGEKARRVEAGAEGVEVAPGRAGARAPAASLPGRLGFGCRRSDVGFLSADGRRWGQIGCFNHRVTETRRFAFVGDGVRDRRGRGGWG